MKTLLPAPWSQKVADLFTPALDGANLDDFKFDVETGKCDLWECDGCYVLTENFGPKFHVWLVAGKNFKSAAHAINDYVKASGGRLTCATYRTRSAGMHRMHGFLNPQMINSELCEYVSWPF